MEVVKTSSARPLIKRGLSLLDRLAFDYAKEQTTSKRMNTRTLHALLPNNSARSATSFAKPVKLLSSSPLLLFCLFSRVKLSTSSDFYM